MHKKLFLLFIMFFSLFMVTGCVQKTGDTEKKRPEAEDGNSFIAQELSFYLPKDFIRSPYYGMLGVYEVYTGDLKDSGATELDIMVLVDSIEEDFDMEQYLKMDSSFAKAKIEYTKKKINDYEWYIGEEGDHHYYCAMFHGNVYDITTTKKEDPTKIYSSALKMLEDTLYFEEMDMK